MISLAKDLNHGFRISRILEEISNLFKTKEFSFSPELTAAVMRSLDSVASDFPADIEVRAFSLFRFCALTSCGLLQRLFVQLRNSYQNKKGEKNSVSPFYFYPLGSNNYAPMPWHFLNFLPEPQ
jgi:hypothetical protein